MQARPPPVKSPAIWGRCENGKFQRADNTGVGHHARKAFVVNRGYRYARYAILLTGNGSFDVNHCLLGSEQRRALVDDAQRGRLVYPAFQNEVLFQYVRPRPVSSLVPYLGRGQLSARRERYACKTKRSIDRLAYTDDDITTIILGIRAHQNVYGVTTFE